MKAILIDPENMTIEEVEYTGGIEQIYELIDAQCFTVANIGMEGDGIFVDDEGLLVNEFYAFRFNDYPQPLAGRGLILGCDDEGATTEPKITIEEVRRKISFLGLCHLG